MGAGNLGLALADYPGFRQEGFEIVALFDTQRDKIGQPRAAASPFTTSASSSGWSRERDHDRRHRRAAEPRRRRRTRRRRRHQGILNFSPGTLKVPADVKLKSVDLTVSLESLSFFLAQGMSVWRRQPAARRIAGTRSTVARRRAGRVRMVDVGDKPVTAREAVARGPIRMSRAALRAGARRRAARRAIRCRRRASPASWRPSTRPS